MNFLNKLITASVVLVMLAAGVLFAIQNTALVPLDLLFIVLPEKSLALWLILALSFGVVLGMVVSWGIILRLKKDVLLARNQSQRHKKELDNFRGTAVKR
jgi:lipopolysaccharide assembly protein A